MRDIEILRRFAVEFPAAPAFEKGGGSDEPRPSEQPAKPITSNDFGHLSLNECERRYSEPLEPLYSEELEVLRREGGTPELLAWAEMVERHVAAAAAGVAADDEAPRLDVRARPGDRFQVISALRTGLACDVHVKNGRGDVVEIHQLGLGEPDRDEVARAVSENETVKVWDQHSDAICDALGPYYWDDGAGFDYDRMVEAIVELRQFAPAERPRRSKTPDPAHGA